MMQRKQNAVNKVIQHAYNRDLQIRNFRSNRITNRISTTIRIRIKSLIESRCIGLVVSVVVKDLWPEDKHSRSEDQGPRFSELPKSNFGIRFS